MRNGGGDRARLCPPNTDVADTGADLGGPASGSARPVTGQYVLATAPEFYRANVGSRKQLS